MLRLQGLFPASRCSSFWRQIWVAITLGGLGPWLCEAVQRGTVVRVRSGGGGCVHPLVGAAWARVECAHGLT